MGLLRGVWAAVEHSSELLRRQLAGPQPPPRRHGNPGVTVTADEKYTYPEMTPEDMWADRFPFR